MLVSANHRVSAAFETIYQSFNRSGGVTHDHERHPEYTQQLLEALGHPERNYPTIMVTGSKGKGSTAYLLSQLLSLAGGPVGVFTSPHLLDNLERIRLNGTAITAHDFVDIFDTISTHLTHVMGTVPPSHYIGPVGVLGAIAAQYFSNARVSWAVFETGRGARFDDVTQVQHETAIITTVLAEHLDQLGPSLSDVAWHKAGAIGPETKRVILGSRSDVLDHAVAKRIRELGISPEVLYANDYVQIGNVHTHRHGTVFTVLFADGRHWPDLAWNHVGPIVQNLATAITAAELAVGPLKESAVRRLLPQCHWPGRGEILSSQPFILLDAAIHPDSLVSVLPPLSPFDQAVLSIPDTKDRTGVQHLLEQHCAQITYTTCSNTRLPYHYQNWPIRPDDAIIEDINTALSQVLEHAVSSDRILLLGTLSFVADVYRYLNLSVSG